MVSVTSEEPLDFPMPRSCPFRPPEAYGEIREHTPARRVVLADGATAWLLTRHEDVRRVLSDSRVSSDRRDPGFPAFFPNARKLAQMGTGSLLNMNPPEHTGHRTRLTSEFTVRRIRAMRPRLQEIVDDRITAILAEPSRRVDLVETLAFPVPSLAICELLGVPYDDRAAFQKNTAAIVGRDTPVPERQRAFTDLRGYLAQQVAAKTKDPGEDLLSRLIARYQAEDVYDAEVLTGISMLLLTGGYETTASTIALGVATILQDPGLRAEVETAPEHTSKAVEEILRYFSVVDKITCRVATEDLMVGDVAIKAGEGIICANAAANHDPAAFPDPSVVDVHRDTRGHVAFGYGVHQCLGQNLARLELEIVYNTLFARIPGLRLAGPAEDLAFNDGVTYSLQRLDVAW
jgi:cytochrome P450